VLAHLAGGVAGGLVAAEVAWLVMTPVRTLLPLPIVAFFLAGLGTVGVLMDAGFLGPPRRVGQVPKSWYGRWGPVRSYAAYGLSLGAGWITAAPFAATYVCFAAAGLAASPLTAGIAGMAFGLGRTILVGPINLHRRLVSGTASLYSSSKRQLAVVSAALCLWVVIMAAQAIR
jgi:hypothetical protein